MKIISIGDIHGENIWKLVVSQHLNADKYIFQGDYFDSFNIGIDEQIKNFQKIMKFKDKNKEKVICLMGNHDFHYWPKVKETYSGYQHKSANIITNLLSTYKDNLQMAYAQENILFSHAGVGETWLKENSPKFADFSEYIAENIAETVNDIWKNKPLSFSFNGFNNTGDDITQTPIWIRPISLIKDSNNFKKAGIIQIIGHTQTLHLDIENYKKMGYFFIDTLYNPINQYLIYENEQFKIGKIIKLKK